MEKYDIKNIITGAGDNYDTVNIIKKSEKSLSALRHASIYSCGLRSGERKQTATMIRASKSARFIEFFLDDPGLRLRVSFI